MRWLAVMTMAGCAIAANVPSRARGLRERMAGIEADTESRRAALETSDFVVGVLERAHGLVRPASSRAKRVRAATARINPEKDLALAESLVSAMERGEDPLRSRAGDWHLAYRSSVDGSYQRYRVFVPPSYDPAIEYPLVVILHGLHGNENTYLDRYVDPRNGDPVLKKLADERGYLVVCPRGRAPSGRYTGTSEQDVLDVIDRVMAVYPVRKDQVFLSGHSLGGVGTMKIGFRFAGRFAALAPVGSAFSGQRHTVDGLPLDNKRDMPVLYVQGKRDRLATLRMGRQFALFARDLLPKFFYKEFAEGHSRLGTVSLPAVFDFFDAVRHGYDLVAEEIPPVPPVRRAPAKGRVAKKRPAAAVTGGG